MNEFESTLATALRDEADRSARSLDTVAAARRLESRLDRVDRDRRTGRTVLVAAVAAALVVAIALVARPTPNARLEPSGTGREVLAPDPFLSNHQASMWVAQEIRLANTTPPRLSRYFPDPRTWGADRTQAATYRDPHSDRNFSDTRMNEYLLQYPDTSSAHRAFLTAFRQAKRCVSEVDFNTIDRPGGDGYGPDPQAADGVRVLRFDEGFAERCGNNRPSVLRVARAGNVLVVIQDATIDDKSQGWLSDAVYQALPQYRWHRTPHPTTSVTSDVPAR